MGKVQSFLGSYFSFSFSFSDSLFSSAHVVRTRKRSKQIEVQERQREGGWWWRRDGNCLNWPRQIQHTKLMEKSFAAREMTRRSNTIDQKYLSLIRGEAMENMADWIEMWHQAVRHRDTVHTKEIKYHRYEYRFSF